MTLEPEMTTPPDAGPSASPCDGERSLVRASIERPRRIAKM